MKMKRTFTSGSVVVLGILALVLVACSGGEAEMPDATGAALYEYVTETNDYTEWSTWTSDQWNDFNVTLTSGEPHGNAVRIYVNEKALDAAGNFDGSLPEGSIIVKENYMSADTANPGPIDALTVMYKVDGFNGDANDWFWLKVSPAGVVDKEGAVDGCIGCHSQPNNQDFVLRYGFGEEPAVSSLSQ